MMLVNDRGDPQPFADSTSQPAARVTQHIHRLLFRSVSLIHGRVFVSLVCYTKSTLNVIFT